MPFFQEFFGEYLTFSSSVIPSTDFWMPPGGSVDTAFYNYVFGADLFNCLTIEDFESSTVGSTPTSTSFRTSTDGITFGSVTGTYSNTVIGQTTSPTVSNGGCWSTRGTKVVNNKIYGTKFIITNLTTGAQPTISFSAPIVAFSFYATDHGDGGGQCSAQLYLGTQLVRTVTPPHTISAASNGAVYFYGVINDAAFDKIVFQNTQPYVDTFGFDGFSVSIAEMVDGWNPVVPTASTGTGALILPTFTLLLPPTPQRLWGLRRGVIERS
jgi:hypothetical protein